MPREAAAFGRYLREQRKRARLSLADVARPTRLTASYIAEVERGERAPLDPRHWPAIAKALAIPIDDLERAAAKSAPIAIDLTHAPADVVDVAIVLARRYRNSKIAPEDTAALLEVLGTIGPGVRAFGRVLDAGGEPVSGRAFAYRLGDKRDWSALVGVRSFAKNAAGPLDGRTARLVGKGFELLPASSPRGAGFFDVPGGLPAGEYALDVHHTTASGADARDWAWPLVVKEGATAQDVRLVCAATTPASSAAAPRRARGR
jgi:transcriptional regulator with XRE-family HTH domain